MATPRTITAYDLELGKLTIHRVAHPDTGNPALQVERRYQFLDSTAAVIEELSGGRVLETIEISSIPPAILSALQVINTWTYERALEQEGMSD